MNSPRREIAMSPSDHRSVASWVLHRPCREVGRRIGIAKKIPAGRGDRTHRIPIRYDSKPSGHSLRGNEGVGDENKGKEEDEADAAADSGFLTSMPAQAPAHVMAKAINRHRPNASRALPTPLWIRQPTARPVRTRTAMAMISVEEIRDHATG